ncbi:hypothetical protein C1H46_008745 [Malus baccata]|uniref:Uncharacterized protein n=1 Tax=Malus baccata TaxID=106549 RepID=A0A540N3I5_MALBA|nr:hypothetical protein C1H46_008745 [Malus baccata]
MSRLFTRGKKRLHSFPLMMLADGNLLFGMMLKKEEHAFRSSSQDRRVMDILVLQGVRTKKWNIGGTS